MNISAFFCIGSAIFAAWSWRWREPSQIPRPGILSDLCLNFALISVWILSESLSKSCLIFCQIFVWIFVWIFWICVWILPEFCPNFDVWILSKFWCLNFVWIFKFPTFYRVFWIQTCLNLSEFVWLFCRNFVWICVWIFVWNLCEVLSRHLSEFCLSFGETRHQKGSSSEKMRMEIKNRGCQEKNTQNSRIGAKRAHPAFFGSSRWTSHPPFLGMGSHQKKGGAKKGGSSFFIQMAHDSRFSKAILEKWGIPHFFLCFVDCVSGNLKINISCM